MRLGGILLKNEVWEAKKILLPHLKEEEDTSLIILIDADDVLVQATEPAIEKYNLEYKKNLCFEDITDFGMSKCIEEGTSIAKYYGVSPFYRTFLPVPGMKEVVADLENDGHTMFIATSSPKNGILDKIECYEEHFPYFSWSKGNIIPIKPKFLLQADVIIDDRIENIISSSAPLKLLVDMPWNREHKYNQNSYIRVSTPEDILGAIRKYHLKWR